MRESVMAAAPRMSMSALNETDDPDRQVRIWLLSAVTDKGATYYRVAGRFVNSGQTWQVNRRYSEFLMLRDTLVKYFSRAMDTCPGCLNYLHAIRSFDFPKKHIFVSKSQIVVNYRVKALRSFMNLLASWAFSNSPKCPTCGGFAFDIVRNFVLEGADAVGEISDMNYIRESFVVSTFTDAGRRSSLTRRNSFVPPSSQPTQSQRRSMQVQQYQQSQRQSQLQRRNTSDSVPGSSQMQIDSDAYDAFNDYLIRHPTKSAHSRSSINIPTNLLKEQQQVAAAVPRASSSRQVSSSSSNSHNPHDGMRQSTNSRQQQHQRTDQNGSSSGAHNGSFLFYQDGVNHVSSSSRGHSRQSPPSSNGSKHGILKNWNDVRQDRSQNGSYMSLGASSTDDDRKTPRGSKQRTHSRNRNDNRSQNNSYFSLGASSADSREANENVAPSSSNKRASHVDTAPQVRYDRSQNESYLSIGGSSDTGDLEEEYHSHHPSVLASPTQTRFTQPPPTQKYVGPSNSTNDVRSAPRSSQRQQPKPAKSKSQHVMDEQSFASDASLRFDGMVGVATDGSDSDDIDIAGVMIDDRHHPQLRKSKSGQGLWATWELAKAS